MINKLIQLDTELFLFLNGLRHPFFDFLFWWASNPWVWLPVYAFFLYLLIRNYKWQTLIILLFVGLCVAITDLTSWYGFKEVFMRYRPTHNPEIMAQVQTLFGYRGGDYGFISSHAANFFGIAAFFIQIFYKRNPYFTLGVILWATLISYSRIYLGVHYPADVICGALLGLLVGFMVGWVFNNLSAKVLSKKRFFSIHNT